MQRFRFLLAVAAISLASNALPANADDTPAQAAARAALEQQMNQMNTEQGSTNSMTPTAPAPAPTTPPPAAQPPPITPPTPQFSTNVPMNADMQSATAPAKLSDTNQPPLTQTKTQMKAAATSVPPAAVLNTNTEQFPVNPAMAPLPPSQTETSSAPSSDQSTHEAPAAEDAGTKSADSNGLGTSPNISQESKSTNSVTGYSPITAPPLPISQEKQQELQSLLSQYMANQVTPEQYQEQRAKIMAEP